MASTDLPDTPEPHALHPPPVDPDVRQAAQGDRVAFERVYRAHVSRVYAICIRMNGRRDGVDELTQDIFVRAWDKLPQFRGDAAFSTWLHRLAVNVILESRRANRRHATRYADEPNDDAPEALADPPPIGDQLDLARAMATLPPGARAVFALHDVEGYKHEEIAEMLGITPGGSKAQLHRARHLLRNVLA